MTPEEYQMQMGSQMMTPQFQQGMAPSTQLLSGYGQKSPAYMLMLIQQLMGQRAPQIQPLGQPGQQQ